MVSNNQWPFENADSHFYATIPQELVQPMEEMLHHVQPGLSFKPSSTMAVQISLLQEPYLLHCFQGA
jgi:hypothetical protein